MPDPPTPAQHYFTAQPAGAEQRTERQVRLGGREVVVETAGGIFSPGGLDKGTAVLLDTVPAPPPAGTFVDVGCGWGPIALSLALAAPAARVWAVDVNARARDLTARNAERLGCAGVRVVAPEEVPADLAVDLIWSNPPVRVGKPALHDLLAGWLPRLRPEGQAWLVVQKNLGADSLQAWLQRDLGVHCERVASSKGFRVLRATRPAPGQS